MLLVYHSSIDLTYKTGKECVAAECIVPWDSCSVKIFKYFKIYLKYIIYLSKFCSVPYVDPALGIPTALDKHLRGFSLAVSSVSWCNSYYNVFMYYIVPLSYDICNTQIAYYEIRYEILYEIILFIYLGKLMLSRSLTQFITILILFPYICRYKQR